VGNPSKGETSQSSEQIAELKGSGGAAGSQKYHWMTSGGPVVLNWQAVRYGRRIRSQALPHGLYRVSPLFVPELVHEANPGGGRVGDYPPPILG
jgi:hypothetical protein